MGKRYCDHEFFTIQLNILSQIDGSIHTVIGCIYCGQIRKLYDDGRVMVTKEEGEVKKTYGNGNPPTNQTTQQAG